MQIIFALLLVILQAIVDELIQKHGYKLKGAGLLNSTLGVISSMILMDFVLVPLNI